MGKRGKLKATATIVLIIALMAVGVGDTAGSMPGMDTDLGDSDASFWGEAAGDNSGCSVAGAGDVNGDGADDILIGAGGNDDGGDGVGQTYLVLSWPENDPPFINSLVLVVVVVIIAMVVLVMMLFVRGRRKPTTPSHATYVQARSRVTVGEPVIINTPDGRKVRGMVTQIEYGLVTVKLSDGMVDQFNESYCTKI